MLDFRKLFLTVVALVIFASLSMTTAAPAAFTNMPAAGFIGTDNLIISQCAVGTAPTASRPTEVVQAHDYNAARVSQAAQLSAHFDGEAATDVALEASTRSPSPPQTVLNHNTAKMVEVDVANPVIR